MEGRIIGQVRRHRAVLVGGVTLVVIAAAVGLRPPDSSVPPINAPARPGGPISAPSGAAAAGNQNGAANPNAATGSPHVQELQSRHSNVDVRHLPQVHQDPDAGEADEDGEEGDEREDPAPPVGGGALAAIGSGEASVSAPAPGPVTSFDGLSYAGSCGGTSCGAGHPPDTNGDVGPTYYIQTINTAVGIFNKSTGSQVAAFTFDALMSQGNFGNLCDTSNFGDPVVLYDTFADRWIITDFAFTVDGSGNVTNPPGAFQCFAVSQSGNPVTGGWYFYSLAVTDALNDYPKLGIWPDGIYMSANMFAFPAGGAFQNVRVWALDKASMYAGHPAQSVSFDVGTVLGQSPFTLLPSNARVQTGTPPAGRPNLFTGLMDFNAIRVWKFHVDWATPANSTFTGPSSSLTGSSWSLPPATVPSKSGNNLDTLSYRLMVQNQYTNIGGVESLWDAHTVAGSSGSQAAVRWYQVPVTGGTVGGSTLQAGTYNPDTDNRFVPSVAANRNGDMAIGYTAAGSTLFPAIRYAGRLAVDPASTITLTEASLIDGTGTQVGLCGGSACSRWGDYSAMTLDPDGCTFWYTAQYYATSGLNHHTRIGSFRFPGCTDVPPPSPSPTPSPTPASSIATTSPDLAPPSVAAPGLSPNPAIPGATVTVTSTATDNVAVASAQKQLNGGAWTSMSAVDGGFGESSEDVTSTITAPATAGTYQVCVRATDPTGNTSNGLACTTLTVMSFALAPVSAGASAAQGNSASWTINITRSSFPGPISFSATGLPSGTTATFVANPSGGASAVLTITTSNCTTPTPRGTFSITVNGTSGGLTRSTTVSLTVTNSAPKVTAPIPSLYGNTTLSTTTVRVKNAWSACDADGLRSYKLQRQVGGGTWTTVSLSSPTTTAINQSLTRSATYRYRVLATDKTGLASSYAYGPSFQAIVSDNTSSLITYSGTWRTGTSSSYFGGHVRYATTAGASATYTINASGAAWIAYKGSTRGSAQVFVDGVLKGTINLHTTTATAKAQVYAFSWVANGPHTIKVVVVSGRVDIDAFVRLVRV